AAAVGQFHDQVSLSIELVEGVNVNDVGMVEGGAGAGFAVEAGESNRVAFKFLAHQFDRDQALQDGVEGAVNFAVAAGGDFAAQLELAQLHRHHDGVPAAFARFGR